MTAPKVVRTMCPMNCHPTFCGMLVEVEGGKLRTVSGDKDNPDSQGFLCVRGRSTNEIFGNPRRLLYPQIRDDRRTDVWRRVSWDEAMDFIARRMRKVGPQALGLWAGHGGFTSGSAVTVQMMYRFANIYGCQSWHPAMICWGLGGFGVGLTGALKVNTKEDMAENSNRSSFGAQTLPASRIRPATSSRPGVAGPRSLRSMCEEQKLLLNRMKCC